MPCCGCCCCERGHARLAVSLAKDVCIYNMMCIYIYILREREIERERESNIVIFIIISSIIIVIGCGTRELAKHCGVVF